MDSEYGRVLVDDSMEPLLGLGPFAKVAVDKADLVELTSCRDVCYRDLVAAQESCLAEAILNELHRPFEHDLFKLKLIVREGLTDDHGGEALLENVASTALAEVGVMLVKVHINKGALTSILWVPVVWTTPRVGKIAQDSVTLANRENDLACLFVNFLHGWDLACWVDSQVGLFRVLPFAHGNIFDLVIELVQSAERGNGACRLRAAVKVQDSFQVSGCVDPCG